LSDLDAEQSRLTLGAWLGDPAALISSLERERGTGGDQAASGYNRMRLATWNSRSDGDTDSALGRLDGVSIGPDDFPWLSDIRLIAKARVLGRAGDAEGAKQLVDEFMGRQPLLFEPWHAFHFGLLDEQEHIKPLYREIRRSGQPPSRKTG
jgi:hypothetical protein